MKISDFFIQMCDFTQKMTILVKRFQLYLLNQFIEKMKYFD